MKRWYVGDGVYGLRRWLFARVIYRIVGWPVAARLDPGLPAGWSWNVRKDDRGLYARHNS